MAGRSVHQLLREVGDEVQVKARVGVGAHDDHVYVLFVHGLEDMLEEFAALYERLTVKGIAQALAMKLREPLLSFFPRVAIEGVVVGADHVVEFAGRVFDDVQDIQPGVIFFGKIPGVGERVGRLRGEVGGKQDTLYRDHDPPPAKGSTRVLLGAGSAGTAAISSASEATLTFPLSTPFPRFWQEKDLFCTLQVRQSTYSPKRMERRNVTQPHALPCYSLPFILIFGGIFATNIKRLSSMERLIVDAEGKIIIPSEVIQRRGLHPGDELALVEVAEGLLVYQGSSDPETIAWWNSLSEEERQLAEAEARRYETLSEEERDAVWKEGAESIETDAEGDEIELPAGKRPA